MKQVLQDLKTGNTYIEECPVPSIKKGHILIETKKSLISAGTERMLVDFGKSNYIEKAKKHPDKVGQVISKIKNDGLGSTIEAVKAKLDTPLPLGYCNVGSVIAVADDVLDIKPGDRVVSNGPHAEVVCVSKNLCAKIPSSLSDEYAVFTVIGSIGLQGIRLLKPSLGDKVVVFGVGLIGMITAQLLVNSGCSVLAIDFDKNKLEILKSLGIETCCLDDDENPITIANSFSNNMGVDGVIITASTKSNDLISQAAQICRKRGSIILVGVTGLNLKREDFYEKEITFQVSCSYGPGRYDSSYEQDGIDYPYGYVRWTEKRNFEAILNKLEEGKIAVEPMISDRFSFEDAHLAYEQLSNSNVLGILLNYSASGEEKFKNKLILDNDFIHNQINPSIGFIGVGNYASRVLIPEFKKSKAQLHTLCSQSGISAGIFGKKNNFSYITTSTDEVFKNDEINTIIIATRHDTHSKFVVEGLKNNKNIYVEKPLALSFDELSEIKKTYEKNKSQLIVGFNRRFSPHSKKIKVLLDNVKAPKSFIFTMNAGFIPSDHWTQDRDIGGGRIIGEACHYIDLMRFFSGSEITSINATKMTSNSTKENTDDKASITLGFKDGSFGTILYLANGSNKLPKERIEIYANGGVLQLDNFKTLKGYDWPGFSKFRTWSQDKGHKDCIKEFCDSLKNGIPIIPADEIFEVSRVTLEVADILSNQ